MKPRFLSATIGDPIARKLQYWACPRWIATKQVISERSHNAIHHLTHWLLISRGAQSMEIENWQSVASWNSVQTAENGARNTLAFNHKSTQIMLHGIWTDFQIFKLPCLASISRQWVSLLPPIECECIRLRWHEKNKHHRRSPLYWQASRLHHL